jgi:hypothetical protein
MEITNYNQINLATINGFMECVKDDRNVNEINSILKVHKIKCETSNQDYKLIKYDKNFLTVDLIPTYGLCRSIIVNGSNNVVCFSPPKSIPAETFMSTYQCKDSEPLIAQEFIEGTMINVFWDEKIGLSGGWEIATRSLVGASGTFYKNCPKTFRDMFLEAAKENNLILTSLNKNYCYSFVMQHPENRIVIPFRKPQLYLVACYTISNTRDGVIITSFSHDVIAQNSWENTTIKFPTSYEFNSYSDLIEKYASMSTSYDIVGVMVKNMRTGERMKIRNPVYEQVRHLRGNQPKLQYQYLSLRREGRVADFLKYYPEHKSDCSSFRDQVHLFTNTLFSNYVSCYIKKEKPLIEFSEQYRTHMFNIHKIYMNDLKPQNLYVTNSVVIRYVNEMHPSLLMYSLNYNMRKRNVDIIKADM